MSTLRAATVSNRFVRRKRKRTGNGTESPEPEDAEGVTVGSAKAAGGSAAAASKKNKKTPAPKKNPNVECVIEWPPLFKELDKTHRALNLVFTFCSTRKHLATTFDTIKSAVESHTQKELKIEDVAAVVALRPEGVSFSYVDEVMLQTDIKGAERDTTFKSGRSRKDIRTQGPAPDASVGGLTGMDALGTHHPDEAPLYGKEVLYFEFIDGDLKRQVQSRKTGRL
ncbi:ATP-dependent helicase [Apiospora saccharicola]